MVLKKIILKLPIIFLHLHSNLKLSQPQYCILFPNIFRHILHVWSTEYTRLEFQFEEQFTMEISL